MNYPRRNDTLSFPQFLTLVILISVAIGVAVTLAWNYQTRKDLYNDYQQKISNELTSRSNVLKQAIASKRKEIEFLHATPPILGVVRARANNGLDPVDATTEAQWKVRLQTIFKAYLSTHPEVMQARYIGLENDGKELVRVDRKGGTINIKGDEALQRKSSENYYKDIMKLGVEGTYFSDITLNREYGEIELPYWPTYRVAKSVFGENGKKFGFVILNYDARPFISAVVNDLDKDIQLYLTNSSGGFVLRPEAGKMLEFEFDSDAVWENQFLYTNNRFLTDKFKRVTPVNSQESLIVSDIKIAIGDQGSERYFDMIIGVKDDVIIDEIAKKRNYIIGSLVATFSVGIVLLAIYQNRIRKSFILLRKEAEYKSIIESSSDAIISLTESGEILSWNNGAELMLGFSDETAVGNNIFKLFVKHSANTLTQNTLHDVIYNSNIKKIEVTAATENGNTIEISATLSPIRLKDGHENIGVAAIMRDITELKENQLKIVNLNSSLEKRVRERTHELEVARNDALQASHYKSEFIANVSHEIRTPMNGVLGMLFLLKKEDLTNKQCRLVKMAEASARALTGLINDILDLSKIEAGKLDIENSEFNLQYLLSDIVATMCLSAYEKGLEFVVDFSQVKYESVVGDGSRIRQVLINLMGNALKFTDRGEVVLKAETKKIDNNTVELYCSVKDTGIGISKENQQRLFESFSQEDSSISRRFGGSGLGLTISRQLCEKMSGSIQVESNKLQGSTFSFHLKLGLAERETPMFPYSILPGLKALIVSSMPSLIVAIGSQLKTWGIQVIEADSIQEFKELQLDQETKFDLIFVDQILNDGQGSTLVVGLAPKPYGNTILLRQPNTIEEDEQSFILKKPVLPIDLWNMITTVLGMKEKNIAERDVSRTDTGGYGKGIFSGITVLVVDDNRINLEVAEGILEEFGLIVNIVDSGKAALALLKTVVGVDLVFMDCQMPEMDGYETARAIRTGAGGESAKNIPIIAMTANAMRGARELCMDAGMNDYMSKPLDPDVLLEKLKIYFNRKPGQSAIIQNEPELKIVSNIPTTNDTNTERIYWDKEAAILRLRGREDRLKHLLGMFLSGFPGDCNELHEACESALKENDNEIAHEYFQNIKRITHKVKGVAGNISAVELFSLCEKLEESAVAEDRVVLQDHFSEFDNAVNATTKAMQLYLHQ